MGHLTVSLSEESERKLRQIAREKYSDRKGALSQTIEDLVGLAQRESYRQRAIQSLLSHMERGYHMGKILYKHRSELYDRKIFSRK